MAPGFGRRRRQTVSRAHRSEALLVDGYKSASFSGATSGPIDDANPKIAELRIEEPHYRCGENRQDHKRHGCRPNASDSEDSSDNYAENRRVDGGEGKIQGDNNG